MLFLLCYGRVKFYKTLWDHVYIQGICRPSEFGRRIGRESTECRSIVSTDAMKTHGKTTRWAPQNTYWTVRQCLKGQIHVFVFKKGCCSSSWWIIINNNWKGCQFSHDVVTLIKMATFWLSTAGLHRADQAKGSTCYSSSTKHDTPPIWLDGLYSCDW